MTTTQTDDHRAKDQAKAQLESIIELVDWLNHANGCTDTDCQEGKDGGDYWEDSAGYHDQESAEQAIQEDPLSVEVRTGWHIPGGDSKPDEFNILLCTGGPAVRIIGDLSEHQEPDSARIEYQDWFTPWESMPIDSEQEEKLLTYCRQFYFGE